MTEQEIKTTLDTVHKMLDSLQKEGSTFLFIADEGNHFAASGSALKIAAHLLFAMCRYPVIEEIIKTCAARFDEVNKEHGDEMRMIENEHQIEEYPHDSQKGGDA